MEEEEVEMCVCVCVCVCVCLLQRSYLRFTELVSWRLRVGYVHALEAHVLEVGRHPVEVRQTAMVECSVLAGKYL